MFESDSEDSFDPEEYGSWTSIAIKGKSCGFGKEEGVEASWKDSVCSTSKASNNHKVVEYGANSSVHNHRAPATPLDPQAQQFNPKPVGESRDQELEQGHACLESAGIRPQRRGSKAGFTPCGDLPDGRERPDGTKDVPLTSEVPPQTSHYLERKAMSGAD